MRLNNAGEMIDQILRTLPEYYSVIDLWQRFFYDHIHSIDISVHKIRVYIVNNLALWDNDANRVINYSIKVQVDLNSKINIF